MKSLAQEPDYVLEAKRLVREYINRSYTMKAEEPPGGLDYEVEVIWHAEILRDWRVGMTSTMPDGLRYVVMHDASTDETDVVAYKTVSTAPSMV